MPCSAQGHSQGAAPQPLAQSHSPFSSAPALRRCCRHQQDSPKSELFWDCWGWAAATVWMGRLKSWPGFSEAFVIGHNRAAKWLDALSSSSLMWEALAMVQHHCTTPTGRGVCQEPCAVPTNRSVTIPSLLQTSTWLITLTRLWRPPPKQPSRLPGPSPGQGSQVMPSSLQGTQREG